MVPPNPISKGRIYIFNILDVLICSRREIPTYSDLQNNEIFDYSLVLQYITSMIEGYYKCNSSTIIINDGEDAGQGISHFHVHIIPRVKEDINKNDIIYLNSKRFDEE